MTSTAGQAAAGTLAQQGAFSQTGGFWPGSVALTQSSIAVNEATGIYGGIVTLTATLNANGVPLNGKSVIFSLNSAAVGAATTDSAGVATLNNVSLSGINAGSYPLAISAQDAENGQFGSWHAGVCNFVFGDGHTTSVTTSIPGTTLGFLATRAGGEVIPAYE